MFIRTCIAGVNPRPARMTDALEGALSDSMASSSAYTSANRVDAVAGAVLEGKRVVIGCVNRNKLILLMHVMWRN